MRRYILQSRHHHVVLGVSPTATRAQIKKAAEMLIDFLDQYDIVLREDERGMAAKRKAVERVKEAQLWMHVRAKAGRTRDSSETFNAVRMRIKRNAELKKLEDKETKKWFEPA